MAIIDSTADGTQQEETANVQLEFLHHLRNTVVLLGGRVDIADVLERPASITSDDVSALCQYSIDLQEGLKDRVVNLNTMTIRVGH